MSTTRNLNLRRAIARTGVTLGALTVALLVSTTAFAQGEFLPHYPTHYAGCSGGAIDVYPGMPSYDLSVSVSGEIACSDVTGAYCPGFVSPENVCLRVIHSTSVDIEVTWANVDTVLALTGPMGVFSDDDGGRGTQSRLSLHLRPGEYTLHQGTYSWRGWGQMRLEVRDAAPAMVVYPTPPPRIVHYPTPVPRFPPIPPRPPVHIDHHPVPPVHVDHHRVPPRHSGDRGRHSGRHDDGHRGRDRGRDHEDDGRRGHDRDPDDDRGQGRDRDRDNERDRGSRRGRGRDRDQDRDSEEFQPTVREEGRRGRR